MSLVGRVPRDRPWRTDRVYQVALKRVDDLARDQLLLGMLAGEFAKWATRWWLTAPE